MYVTVVGAGEVGSYVAERLSRQGIDVAVVETDAHQLHSWKRTSTCSRYAVAEPTPPCWPRRG